MTAGDPLSTRLVVPVSAAPDRPLVPEWLAVPDDANALVDEVWPASAQRDEHGELRLAGVAVSNLRERFGTPLYVLDEDAVRARAREVREAFAAATARHGVQAPAAPDAKPTAASDPSA